DSLVGSALPPTGRMTSMATPSYPGSASDTPTSSTSSLLSASFKTGPKSTKGKRPVTTKAPTSTMASRAAAREARKSEPSSPVRSTKGKGRTKNTPKSSLSAQLDRAAGTNASLRAKIDGKGKGTPIQVVGGSSTPKPTVTMRRRKPSMLSSQLAKGKQITQQDSDSESDAEDPISIADAEAAAQREREREREGRVLVDREALAKLLTASGVSSDLSAPGTDMAQCMAEGVTLLEQRTKDSDSLSCTLKEREAERESLDTAMEEMAEELAEKGAERERLAATLKEREAERESLESAMVELGQERESLEQERDSAREALASQTAERDTLVAERDIERERRDTLVAERDTTAAALASEREDREREREEREALVRALQGSEEEREDLKAQMAGMEAELEREREAAKGREEDMRELEALRQHVENMDQRYQCLGEEKERESGEREKEREKLQAEVDALTAQISDTAAAHAQSIAALQAERQTEREEREKVESHVVSLRTEMETLAAALEAEKKERESERALLHAGIERETAAASAKEEERAALEVALKGVEGEREALAAQLAEAETTAERERAERERLVAETKEVQESLDETLKSLADERESRTTTVAALETEIKGLAEERDAESGEKESLAARLAALTAETEKEREEREKEREERERELDSARQAHQTAEATAQSAASMIASIQDEWAASEQLADTLQAELEEANARHDAAMADAQTKHRQEMSQVQLRLSAQLEESERRVGEQKTTAQALMETVQTPMQDLYTSIGRSVAEVEKGFTAIEDVRAALAKESATEMAPCSEISMSVSEAEREVRSEELPEQVKALVKLAVDTGFQATTLLIETQREREREQRERDRAARRKAKAEKRRSTAREEEMKAWRELHLLNEGEGETERETVTVEVADKEGVTVHTVDTASVETVEPVETVESESDSASVTVEERSERDTLLDGDQYPFGFRASTLSPTVTRTPRVSATKGESGGMYDAVEGGDGDTHYEGETRDASSPSSSGGDSPNTVQERQAAEERRRIMEALRTKLQESRSTVDTLKRQIEVLSAQTFSTPHGGGGPGAGPVVYSKALTPFVPVPKVVAGEDGYEVIEEDDLSLGRMTSFFGQFGVLLRALTWIVTLGGEGLRASSHDAVLNANYMLARLTEAGLTPAIPNRMCMHEFALSDSHLAGTGVSTLDIAKGLCDAGFHPSTVYFPLFVEGAMLIEPTESESLESLDSFCDALIDLANKAKAGSEDFHAYPQATPCTRVDEVLAAKKQVFTW
ncbi:glycine cleavage system P protein, partial [Kipferlia bialata]